MAGQRWKLCRLKQLEGVDQNLSSRWKTRFAPCPRTSMSTLREVWRHMQRRGFSIARCTVERLMRDLGLQGVIRSKAVLTTMSDNAARFQLDAKNRHFHAP